jgi:hypothetical protein
MKLGRFCPSRSCCAIPRSEFRLAVRGIAACLLTAALGTTGCTRNPPVQKWDPPAAIEAAPQGSTELSQPSELNQLGGSLPTEPHVLEGSGVTVWAKEFPGQLIAGLDGGLYEPYRQTAIERVQMALRDRGLYEGPMNGVLDRPTMNSIYAFQEANDILQRCGIPTPHTRKMLKQGSHTDLSS